jgi:hypothetical protein
MADQESELELELEDEFEGELEGEDEGEGEDFLGGLGKIAGGLLGEGEDELEAEDESEDEDELEGEDFLGGLLGESEDFLGDILGEGEDEFEDESEQFFGSFLKKALPVLKKVAKVAAPIVGTAIGGPIGGKLGSMAAGALGEGEFEDESEDEFEDEGESETASEISGHPLTNNEAVAEMMAEAASVESREGEAEAMAGAAVVAVISPKDRRALRRILPHLTRGTAILTRILRRRRSTRMGVRAVPTIMRRTVKSLKRQAAKGKKITRRRAGRTAARQIRRVLGNSKAAITAIRRNRKVSRAYKRPRHMRRRFAARRRRSTVL